MTPLDEQFEELISNYNKLEADNKSLNNESHKLKAQINYLRGQASLRGDLRDDAADILARTKDQCLNDVKADAIDEMCDKMPSSGFTKMRDQSNWIGNYQKEMRGDKNG